MLIMIIVILTLLVSIRLKIPVSLRPGGVLPYMGYIGMCGPKGYGFSAVLVINWVSIFAQILSDHCLTVI